jgi:hypothetical protein
MMRRTIYICLLPFAICHLPCRLSFADGLSTSFADVTVANVPVGKPWSIRTSRKAGLVLQNLGDRSIHVQIKIFSPRPDELRGNAEALPRADWITVLPNEFELAPHAQRDCDVIIDIPKQTEYRGRSYQAMVFSRGAPAMEKGINFGAGLVSRLHILTEK